MSPIEFAAAALGVINIWLIMRRSIWNYAFGIPMVLLYMWIFFQAKLYSDALLQIYFLGMQGYGVWNWLQGRSDDGLVVVETMTNEERAIWGGVTLGAALVIGFLFSHFTDAALPWVDAPIAAMSIVAQYLMSIRKIENWLLWIAVDFIAVGIYPVRGLYLTTALYFLFLVLSIIGLIEWNKQLNAQTKAQHA
ncbi:MAG TPA: nicotinamide riboside transporter PnuC [Rhizomicrobium sp.]|nr:nicotinamide riboside transporter PnuC [Rhizomicrobium sp.]